MPVPAPTPPLTRLTMFTTPASTASATADHDGAPVADEPPREPDPEPEPGAGTLGSGEEGTGPVLRGATASVASPTSRPPAATNPPTSRATTRKMATNGP